MKSHPDDGKFVVVKNGVRISDLHESEQAAIAEASRQLAIAESEPCAGTRKKDAIQVKKNLLG